MRAQMSETELSRAIQAALATMNVWCLRINSGKVRVKGGWMHLSESGSPDLMCPALGLWLEVKTQTGKLTEDQVKWHARAERERVRVVVVRSVSEAITAVTASCHTKSML